MPIDPKALEGVPARDPLHLMRDLIRDIDAGRITWEMAYDLGRTPRGVDEAGVRARLKEEGLL